MLVARGARPFGSARLAWTLTFAAKQWYAFVEREGLVLDSRFVPGAEGPARANVCLHLLLDGYLEPQNGSRIDAPAWILMSEEQVEGANGRRVFTYRAGGEPYRALQVQLPAAHVRLATTAAPVSRPLTASTVALARRATEIARGADDVALGPAVSAVMHALADEGIVTRTSAENAAKAPPALFVKFWQALRPMIERFYLAPTVAEFRVASGLPLRQIDRQIQRFVTSAGHLGLGWRHATRHTRLKLAVLLLSAEDLAIGEVASAVGYGSTDAMARAFRDAGIVAPSAVREAVRGKVSAALPEDAR